MDYNWLLTHSNLKSGSGSDSSDSGQKGGESSSSCQVKPVKICSHKGEQAESLKKKTKEKN